MHVLNEFLTADRSYTTKVFSKQLLYKFIVHFLRFVWHLLRQNFSIIGDTVSLWNMFEYRQFTIIEGKCRWFRNSSECLKAHCSSNNWPIWTHKVPKEARVNVWTKIFYKSFFKNILFCMNIRWSKIRSVHMYV